MAEKCHPGKVGEVYRRAYRSDKLNSVDESTRVRRLLALTLHILQRHPLPAYVPVLEQYREDFLHLRVGLMTGRVESSWGEGRMQELGAQVESLLGELRERLNLAREDDFIQP